IIALVVIYADKLPILKETQIVKERTTIVEDDDDDTTIIRDDEPDTINIDARTTVGVNNTY
ncbi:MAG TPA: hypothetical protein VJK52_06200, partial [Candidatus Nanoarchaeia archaeon]|nr:hypothetical protein [Candidatus Nanoarchaeia archaeon]